MNASRSNAAPCVLRRHLRLALPLLCLAALPGSLAAVPLRDVPVELVQPWGERLQALATGDEFRRRLHDASNHTLVHDPATGAWVYADLQAGRLVPTAFAPGDLDPDALGLPPGLDLSPELARSARVPLPRPLALAPSNAPTTGSLNNLVVFVRFADEAEFGEAASTFDALFNTGNPSLRSYYAEVSYGKLTISTRFLPAPSNGWVVSYKDAHTRAYYRPFSLFTNPEGYASDTDRYDREQALIYSATVAVRDALPGGVDLDGDDDGKVDNVCYVVSGAADGWSDLLWSHMWELYQYNVTVGGAAVVTFDLIMRDQLDLFTLSHEMFHSLGAPDLYHYSQDGRTTVGDWDLMESGKGHMSAWMKHRYGGWLALPVLGPGTHTLQPLAAGAGSAGIVDVPNSGTQQLVVEYRRKTGVFENNVPGSGLVIYRVDTTLNGNADGPPDELYAFRAGGTPTAEGTWWDSTFTSDVLRSSFGPGTDPAPFLSNGTPVPVRIDDIGPAGATITFTIKDCASPCAGRVCGDDGCGGTCGTCASNERCEDGVCGVCLDPPSPTCTHTFTAPSSAVQPDYVWLTGSWLGWPSSPAVGAIPLALGADGRWSADVPLPTGASVQYKYLVRWFGLFDQWCVVAGGEWSCNNDPNMTTTCTPPCVDFCVAAAETCNHVDDDCDGQTDEGLSGCCSATCDGRECGGDGCFGSCGACPAGQACYDGTCGVCLDPAPGSCDQPFVVPGTAVQPESVWLTGDWLGWPSTPGAGALPLTLGAWAPDPTAWSTHVTLPALQAVEYKYLVKWPDTGVQWCVVVDGGSWSCSGDPNQTVTCAPPCATLCDPAPEACNQRDDDCDGQTDEELPGCCFPSCAGRECGDDGCGGSCGGCDDGNVCTVDQCLPVVGLCAHPAAAKGLPCSDGNACTHVDACDDGACVGGDEVTCPAKGPCRLPGTCDPATGSCDDPAKPDGLPCSDDNACTQIDACLGGECAGSAPVACRAPGPCELAVTCNPATGACDATVTPFGVACDDGDACTGVSFCSGGACVGAQPLACPAPAACHAAGTCDPATGTCSTPVAPDDTPCDDASACTRVDLCRAGTCRGTDPVVCAAADACHLAGSCEPTTGTCSAPLAPDGTACPPDALACTADACQAGACAHPVVDGCLIDQACVPADDANPLNACEACQPADARDAWSPRADGTTCSDQLFCTDGDACNAGLCQPGAPRACPAATDDCHEAACDEQADACTLPARPDDTPCDDADLCSTRDECEEGACVGSDPVACAAPEACREPGVCLPATGLCAYAPQPDGTPCDDGAYCTVDDTCATGACSAGAPRDCGALAAPCLVAACDEAGDACVASPLPEGTACGNPRRCDDGELEEADACDAAGTCVDGGLTPCAPYVTCATTTSCASSCTAGDACVNGLDCVGGACVLNQAPVAVAGAAQSVDEAAQVTLAGDGSSDPEGQPLAYAWQQVAGPAVQLDDAAAERAHFVAPKVVAPVVLSFRLVVSDGLRESEPAVALVSVANSLNEAPLAQGFAETPEVDEGAELTLDASDSVDPNGDPLSFLWIQQAGPAAELAAAEAAVLVAVAPQVDADTWLTFQLVVSDGADDSAPLVLQVLVRDRSMPEPDPETTPDVVEALDGTDPTDADAGPEAGAETTPDAAAEADESEPADLTAGDATDTGHAEAAPDVPDATPYEADAPPPDVALDVPGPEGTRPEGVAPDLGAPEGVETDPGSGGGSGCAVTRVDSTHAQAGALALAGLVLAALLALRDRRPRRALALGLLLGLLAGCLSATRQRPDRDAADGDTVAELSADLAADAPLDTAADPSGEATPDIAVDAAPDAVSDVPDAEADSPTDVAPDTCPELPCSPGDYPELHAGPCEQLAWSPTLCACVVVPIDAPTPCDDGNPCTLGDGCKDGACDPGYPDPTCDCNPADDTCEAEHGDADACNGTLHCVDGACAVDPDTVPEPCYVTGLAPCHVRECVPATGGCAERVADDGTSCSDGDPCTLSDGCAAGQCVSGVPRACDDGDPCTLDACLAGTGLCQHTLLPTSDPEACNGADDDCDGQTDEGPGGAFDSLCALAEACVDGACVFSCTFDDDCGSGQVCVPSDGLGACVTGCVTSCPSGLGYVLFDGCHCKVPSTGADKCLVPGGWATCDSLQPGEPGYGQDATFSGHPLAFTDLGDGTVRDEQTWVVWSRALLPAGYALADAKAACQANAAGLPGSGWSVPYLHALVGLVDFGVTDAPFWNHAAFSDLGGWSTWSATPAPAGGGTPHMIVDFVAATIGLSDSDNRLDVRCARLPAPTPVADRFVVNRVGDVVDRLTGLTWRVQNACAQCTWFAALTACVDLGAGWRLPTAKEALSLLDFSIDDCTVLPAQFGSGCPMYADYWTATPYPDARAAALDIGIGYLQPKATSEKKAARCVRDAP